MPMTLSGHEATARAIIEQINKRRHARDELPSAARDAILRMAGEIDAAHNRIERLERVIAALAIEAARGE